MSKFKELSQEDKEAQAFSTFFLLFSYHSADHSADVTDVMSCMDD